MYLAEGGYDQTYLGGFCRHEPTVLNKVCVHDRVEQVVINRVVHVRVLVVVTPAKEPREQGRAIHQAAAYHRVGYVRK